VKPEPDEATYWLSGPVPKPKPKYVAKPKPQPQPPKEPQPQPEAAEWLRFDKQIMNEYLGTRSSDIETCCRHTRGLSCRYKHKCIYPHTPVHHGAYWENWVWYASEGKTMRCSRSAKGVCWSNHLSNAEAIRWSGDEYPPCSGLRPWNP
jgi:hypothetical protein